MPETTDPDGYIVATRNSTGMVRLSWSADVLRTRDEADEELELARSHETGLSWLLFEVREAGAVPGTPAATTTDQRTAANVLADAIRKQAANRDDLVRMVETQLAEDLHEDQCHCDNYPAACDSGLTRDSLACAAFSPEATIQVLWELGLLALSPAPVPDDTQRTVLAELAAGMRQITELVGMDSEAGEVGPVVERVRAMVSPAPRNEPRPDEPMLFRVGDVVRNKRTGVCFTVDERGIWDSAYYDLVERDGSASVAQEGGEQ